MGTYKHSELRKLTSGKEVLTFIPDLQTLRVYNQVREDFWRELYLTAGSLHLDPMNFSYQDREGSLTFSNRISSTYVRIEYEHNGVINPSSSSLIPRILQSWSGKLNFFIKDGLYVTRTYVNGATGWNGWNMQVSSGSISFRGDIYSVGENYYDLQNMGAAAGQDMVTGFLMYFTDQSVLGADSSKSLKRPELLISGRHMLDDGGGIDAAMNSLYNTLYTDKKVTTSSDNYAEVLRGAVVSQGVNPPQLHIYYTPKSRILDFHF